MPILSAEQRASIVKDGRDRDYDIFSTLAMGLVEGGELVTPALESPLHSISVDPDDRTVTLTANYFPEGLPFQRYSYQRRVFFDHERGETSITDRVSIRYPGDEMRTIQLRRDFREGFQSGENEVSVMVSRRGEQAYRILQDEEDPIKESVYSRRGEIFGTGDRSKPDEKELGYWNSMREDFLPALEEEVDHNPYVEISRMLVEELCPIDDRIKFSEVLNEAYEIAKANYPEDSPPYPEMELVINTLISEAQKRIMFSHAQRFRFAGRWIRLEVNRDYGRRAPRIRYTDKLRNIEVSFEPVDYVDEDDPGFLRSRTTWEGEPMDDFEVPEALLIETMLCQSVANVTGLGVLQQFKGIDLEPRTVRMLEGEGYEVSKSGKVYTASKYIECEVV